MAVSVSSSVNILNASSPFPVRKAKHDDSAFEPSILTVSTSSQSAGGNTYGFAHNESAALPVGSVLQTIRAEFKSAYKPPTEPGNTTKSESAAPPPAILHPTLHPAASFDTVKTKSSTPEIRHTPVDFNRAAAAFSRSSRLSTSFAPQAPKLNSFA